ncbi:glutaredoxin family protein [Ideonella sp. 4Y11]|uniref:Glutaredoxin family protein n=1 Tax=Ideonella aquatica TaxID=2824119 RepID=A0A940YTS0_9BURK|nr:glutaredoxin family protein [Ideonella aquatica]MBQ0961703.1 glutaredoxin family protein [Ideonella aquatica]
MNHRPFFRPVATLALAALGLASAWAQTLPYELREASSRYPVQLITGKDCRACDPARQLLVQRGVPFAEKRVETPGDIAALRHLTGATSLPVLIVGRQQVVGLVSQEWNSYLDAAGYPKDNRLPKNWTRPAAEPLGPALPPAVVSPAPASPPPAEPSDDPSRPKIRF